MTSIGIDIGATKILVAMVDASGNIQKRIKLPTRIIGDPKPVLNDIIEAIQQITTEPIEKIGLGVAGQVNSESGLVYFAPNLNWRDFPLGSSLQQQLKIPVFVTNDVRAATLAEWKIGAGKDSQDIVCMLIGTGIGGGIVSGNRLLTGSSNIAGELGHITVQMNGPICKCGNHGCMEALAGGWGLVMQAIEKGATDHWGKSEMTGAIVIKAYREEDQIAVQVVERAREALVAGATTIVNALNPECLIIGGGILQGLPEIVEWIDAGVHKYALKTATTKLKVLPAHFGADSVVIGASLAANYAN